MAVAVTETVPIEPTVIVSFAGERSSATRSGGGGAVTVTATFVVCVSTPDVPVIVTVVVPVGASAVAWKTIGSVQPLSSVLLAGAIVTPVGSPRAVKVTSPAK